MRVRRPWLFCAVLWEMGCGGRTDLDVLTEGASLGGVTAIAGTKATGGVTNTGDETVAGEFGPMGAIQGVVEGKLDRAPEFETLRNR